VLDPLSYVKEIASIEETLTPDNPLVARKELRVSHNVGTPMNFIAVTN
jgi:hypothetical protein